MLRPVGSQPASVYWRRRLLLVGTLALLIVLLVVTVDAVTSGSGGAPSGAATGATGSTTAPARPSPTRVSTSGSTASSATQRSSSPVSSSAPTTRPPVACRPADLDVAAVTGKSSYSVGQQPKVEMQVTDVGSAPCVQDLADRQVVLKVYNGESRVWGSHDCQTAPGVDKRVLAVNRPVRVSVTWSGLSSEPNCAGTRQHVGAGTYTLYAQLSGKTGRAARFTIN